MRTGVTSVEPNASRKSSGYVRPAIQEERFAGIAGESRSGVEAATRAATSVHVRPSCAISIELVGGPVTWLSSAPPNGITIVPVRGSENEFVVRPSQKRSG